MSLRDDGVPRDSRMHIMTMLSLFLQDGESPRALLHPASDPEPVLPHTRVVLGTVPENLLRYWRGRGRLIVLEFAQCLAEGGRPKFPKGFLRCKGAREYARELRAQISLAIRPKPATRAG